MGPSSGEKERKNNLRACTIARRDGIPASERASRSELLCRRLLDETRRRLPAPAVVAAFYPLGSEVDLRPYLVSLLQEGYRVALPAMVKGADGEAGSRGPAAMSFYETDLATLSEGKAAFLAHPARAVDPASPDLAECAAVAPGEIDMAVVPLVAFDSRNRRLGYGGGNYDRFLGALRSDALVVGAAFAEQEVDDVPTEPHDRPLPAIVAG